MRPVGLWQISTRPSCSMIPATTRIIAVTLPQPQKGAL
jgi:hypothetical protein